MKKKGDLLRVTQEIHGKKFPIFWFAKIARDQYLIVLDAIFRKDPIDRRYAIVSEKRFKKASKGHELQAILKK